MSSLLTFVKGGLIAGLSLGISRLVAMLPVIEKTEEERIFQSTYPGISSQRDLAFAVGLLLDFKIYAPGMVSDLVQACEKAVRTYMAFMQMRTTATNEQLCRYPLLISNMGAEACEKADLLSLKLLSARSDLEQEVASAVELVKKTMDDLFYNAQQELDVILTH